MAKLKLGVIVGSNRRESINRQLANALAKLGSNAFEVKFLQIDDLPLYNPDDEAAYPAQASRLKSDIEASDALLFVTPEYGRTFPTVLKNALDWAARPWGKNSFPGKPGAIIGTSGGAISSALAQHALRAVLGTQGVHVMGGEAYIQFKPDLIDADGNVTDENVTGFLKAYVDNFASFAGKLAAK